jgi:hypothetical protein
MKEDENWLVFPYSRIDQDYEKGPWMDTPYNTPPIVRPAPFEWGGAQIPMHGENACLL